MFRNLIANEIARRGISVREAARQIGLNSHGTLINVLNGRPMEVETAHLICKWLGVPLTAAVESDDGSEKALSAIATVLHSAPELEKLFIRAAEEVEKGNLSIGDFKELLDFTAFKIQQGLEHQEFSGTPIEEDHEEK